MIEMIKTAIFVEGQTELIIVREFLLKWYDYGISLNCFNLPNKKDYSQAEYEFPNPTANKFFLIINCGSDVAVLPSLLIQEKYLFNKGYSKIIGLRDMYSEAYKRAVKNRTVSMEINQKIIQANNDEIEHLSSNNNNIHFHFAIMEIEAWLWGLKDVFQKIDQRLSNKYILEQTGFNIETDDPETTFFHPSVQLAKLFSSIGKSYDKSKEDVDQLANQIEKTDYQNLLESPKCNSFNAFLSSVST